MDTTSLAYSLMNEGTIQPQQAPRTAADVGLNLIAELIRKKKGDKQQEIGKADLQMALDAKTNGDDKGAMEILLGSKNSKVSALGSALMGKEFGVGGESDNVQSVFTTPEGMLGYLTRSGKPVITDQSVNKGLNINQQTGIGINPLTGQAFDLANQPLQTIGGGQSNQTLLSRQSQLDQEKLDRERKSELAQKEGELDIAQYAENKKLQEKKNTTFNTWNSAKQEVEKSFADTTTFAGRGLLPNMSAESQTAAAASKVAATALKAVVRESGEGTFAKDDRIALEELLPTMNDLPEARANKLRMVDGIVRMKLGQPPAEGGIQMSEDDFAAIKWAKQNPNDPKSKIILQSNGLLDE
jgi:hypothetical protein